MQSATFHVARDPALEIENKYKDRCSLSRELASELDVDRQDHVRLDTGPYSTYYRIETLHDDPSRPIVVHEEHVHRFGAEPGSTVNVSTTIPRESPSEARERGGLAETLIDDGTQDRVLVTAPHGGAVERGTDVIAEYTYELLREAGIPVSLWMLRGYNPPDGSEVTAHRRWHVGKPIDARSGYPGLRSIVDRGFDVVIGFHRSGFDEIEVGGRIDAATRAAVADRLRTFTDKPVRSDLDSLRLPGTHPRVSVNYLSEGGDNGLHIECTPGTCTNYRRETARAVAEALDGRL
ncbi:hypothetical protein [Natronoglomus mannanivorans]|uniref:Uncharacterized protein n=1 Tax=Natronoglomus mannanivorans TaxID=2979990 RepID=A0AAP2Z3Q1_9EURY|nr:hypothetical protein [Halobacteria archaeon AArc-xg1-1]